MSEHINFNKELIYKKESTLKKNEVLAEMAELLRKNGFVKDTYGEALIKREEEYPTGLETGEINAAIAVGILKNPIDFNKMEEPENSTAVRIIIMLALDSPHGHIDMLGKIIEMIKNRETLNQLVKEDNKEEIYKIISKHLL